ncbi:MAG: dephospho-CoA kinase [Ekhidna sp.]|nr:dephospho-CoA kinase [Ekhidna sp.]
MTNSLPVFGVTGGIGSGKSTVCKVFEVLGARIYYADDRAKWLMENEATLINDIKRLFGDKVYLNGKLDRQYIAGKAFHDASVLQQLNEAVHPVVRKDVIRWVNENEDAALLLKEAALLFETGSYKELNKTILVHAPVELRIERVLNRDPHRSEQDIQAIIGKQMSEEEKLAMADFVITNDGSESVIKQVHEIFQNLVVAQ